MYISVDWTKTDSRSLALSLSLSLSLSLRKTELKRVIEPFSMKKKTLKNVSALNMGRTCAKSQDGARCSN